MGVLITGGTVVNADLTIKADVYCEAGKIVAIGDHLSVPEGTEVIDATEQYVMPGGIDPHTHMQLPLWERSQVKISLPEPERRLQAAPP